MGEKRELNDDLLKGAKAAAEYIGAGVTPRIICLSSEHLAQIAA